MVNAPSSSLTHDDSRYRESLAFKIIDGKKVPKQDVTNNCRVFVLKFIDKNHSEEANLRSCPSNMLVHKTKIGSTLLEVCESIIGIRSHIDNEHVKTVRNVFYMM